MIYIPTNIRYLRKLKGLKQRELAEKLNVKAHSICQYEIGTNAPTIDNLVKLSDLFNVSIEQFVRIDLSDEMKKIKTKDELTAFKMGFVAIPINRHKKAV